MKRPSLLQKTAAVGDVVGVVGLYAWMAIGFGIYGADWLRLLTWCVVLAAVWLGFAVRHRIYEVSLLRERVRSAYVAAKVMILAGAVFHLIPLIGGPIESRITSATIVLVLTLAVAEWRLVFSFLATSAIPDEPADLFVVGTGPATLALATALDRRPGNGVRIAAIIERQPTSTGLVGGVGVPVVPFAELPGLVRRSRRRPRVVLGTDEESRGQVYDVLTALAQDGVELVSVAAVYEEITECIPVWHLGNTWWALLPRPSSDLLYMLLKRTLDVGGALLGLLALGVLLPVIGPFLKRETGGSLLFRQTRIGKDGQPFDLIKLRTLPTLPVFADHWQRKNHNQAARLGALLRSTGIDELPQCWNVLRGQMSLAGPRPYVPEEVADFQARIPFFRSRAQVRPGITGWAQVNWSYGLSINDEVEKLQYDLYYVGHQSLYLDLVIVLRTVAVLARRRRRLPVAVPEVLASGEI